MDAINIRFGRFLNNIKSKVSAFFSCMKSEKKYLFFASILAVVAIGLILPSGNVHAGSVGEGLSGFVLDLIAPIIYLIFYVFLYIAYAIAWIGADIINITLDPSVMNSVLNISQGSSLYQGWAIFRDIANLLFILILLLVAFGTIFRSDTYNIKKSLSTLIIVAFLINFSAMVTGVVIDFTNILMFGITKMMCTGSSSSCSQDFFNALMKTADALFWKYRLTGWDGIISFDFKNSAAIAIAAIYVFIYGMVLMALGVFFLIRIAAFALLIVLSPLAFFGQIAPGLKGISNKWWDNLLQYAFFGPIAMLLLYVSGLMAQNLITVPTAIFEVNKDMSWLQQDISLIVSNIIPLIFLIAIIPITRSMGIAMSGAVFSGVQTATFGGMASVGRAWGQGKLFPGQQYITNAGKWAGGQVLKRSPYLNTKWTSAKGKYNAVKTNLSTKARGVGGGKAGRYYDWAKTKRSEAEIYMFKEEKTLGKYAEMALRNMNPVLLGNKYKKWLKDTEYDNYKIPLGASPDERKKIELVDANKAVSELKSAGGFDNPEIVSDRAADEFAKGNNLTFEILTKLLAAQDKQFKVLSSINRKNGLADTDPGAFAPNAEGWGKFLLAYKGKVGLDQASNFGQEVGSSAAKESNWSASNIAYYKDGKNYIRDMGTAAGRTPAQQAEYDEYTKKNAEAMGKKSIASKWNNMSEDNFVRELAGGPTIVNIPINGVATDITVEHETNEQGIEYVNSHMSDEEIEKNVGKGSPEKMKKIRDGIAYTLREVYAGRIADPYTDRARAEKLRDKISDKLGR